ncbi:hypothetical protein PHET_07779 [Paragonimus heterotremus]|uniref:C2H2-type domain-containing protein n=1 Tax=Paragonimus heterotremus TaxID=100268 RepID=A0A8J4TD10_9TREM|nr:hypothetical protein PHET_07779 [Paragonimus heterotremus]
MSVDKGCKGGPQPLLFSGGYRLKVLPCLLATKQYCDGLQHAHTLASQLQSWQSADLVRLSVYLSTSTSCCFELSSFAYVEAKTMASELAATRMPLLQKQPHVEHFDLDSGNVNGYPSVYASIHEPVIMGHPCTVSKAESPSVATGVMDSSNLGVSYVYSAGFRYQIRRPVESWKFIETQKHDGSTLYLCRVCHSSYKHKKSLNKHWKDKHSEIPRPAGFHAEEEEDDDDDDDAEESDGEGPSADNVMCELENSENIPPLSSGCVHKDVASTTGLPVSTSSGFRSYPTISFPRRLSVPVRRTVIRNSYCKRTSFAGNSRDLVGNHVTREHESKKRPRSDVTIPVTSITTHRKEPNHFPTGLVSENSTAKRRPTTLRLDSSSEWITNKEERELSNKLYDASVKSVLTSNVPSAPTDRLSSSEHFGSSVATAKTVESPMKSFKTTKEPQPLDLSLLRIPEVPAEDGCAHSTIQVTEPYSNKSVPGINCSLLIGLLQTALNTLTAEKQNNEDRESMLRLSRTSASLLFGIGTLLVALMDDSKEEKHSKLAASPALLTVGAVSKRDDTCELSVHSSSSPPVLPPAPQSVIRSSALDRLDEATIQDCLSSPVRQRQQEQKQQLKLLENEPVYGTPPRQIHNCEQAGGLKSYRVRHSSTVNTTTNFNTPSPQSSINIPSLGRHSLGNHKESILSTRELPLPKFEHSTITTALSVASLTDKLTEVEQTAEQPYECTIICPVCKFDARWFSELRAHMVNHSGHRMFGCCYCPYRAKWKWDVAKHMRRCPLGRHVAHLSNESLLRIVRYHPPPPGNILFNYFPQDGFPGVGIDRPPTPPSANPYGELYPTRVTSDLSTTDCTQQYIRNTPVSTASDSEQCLQSSYMKPPPQDGCDSTGGLQHKPAVNGSALQLSGLSSTLSEPYISCDRPSDYLEDSPQALVIVDEDVEPTESQMVRTTCSPNRSANEPRVHSQMPTSQKDVHDGVRIASATEVSCSGLIFRLRKCSHCGFHSADDEELRVHSLTHTHYSRSDTN